LFAGSANELEIENCKAIDYDSEVNEKFINHEF